MIDKVTDLSWRGRHWIEWSIQCYFVGWVALGAGTPLLSAGHTAYAVASALVGAWGGAAWAAEWRRTETTAIWALAAVTVLQAVPLTLSGTTDGLVAGARLLLAPLAMLPLGALRRTEVMLSVVRHRRDHA